MTASRKLAHDNVFLKIFSKKLHYKSKRVIALNLYIDTSMQICRNKELQRRLLEKWFMTKPFIFFCKKAIFYPKIVATPKQIISHKSVHWYQCISLWKMLGGEY